MNKYMALSTAVTSCSFRCLFVGYRGLLLAAVIMFRGEELPFRCFLSLPSYTALISVCVLTVTVSMMGATSHKTIELTRRYSPHICIKSRVCNLSKTSDVAMVDVRPLHKSLICSLPRGKWMNKYRKKNQSFFLQSQCRIFGSVHRKWMGGGRKTQFAFLPQWTWPSIFLQTNFPGIISNAR